MLQVVSGIQEKLERIQYQSSQIVGMFRILQQNARNKTGYAQPPEPLKEESEKIKPAESHLISELWDNDIDRQRMNEIDDLDLNPDFVILIYSRMMQTGINCIKKNIRSIKRKSKKPLPN